MDDPLTLAQLIQVVINYTDHSEWVLVPEGVSADMADLERRRKERREAQVAIEEKAKALFLSCLTSKQREQYDQQHCFKVVGSSRGRYLIDCTHMTYNVTRLRNRKPAGLLCAYPPGLGSNYDVYLAQKCLLESNEQAFLAVANYDYCF